MKVLDFNGQVAIVTGAERGIGKEKAFELAKRGANIIVNDYNDPFSTVNEIIKRGGTAVACQGDVREVLTAKKLVKTALDNWGRLDIVVNNAGIPGTTLQEPELTQECIGVHLIGTMNMLREAIPVFLEAKYGRIINTGSGSMFGMPDVGDYAAAKGGIFSLTRTIANEFKRNPDLDIKANVILPILLNITVADEGINRVLLSCQANRPPRLVALLAHKDCQVTVRQYKSEVGVFRGLSCLRLRDGLILVERIILKKY